MVIVTLTQELKSGDFLLRFKAEASQDDIHGSRSIFRPDSVIYFEIVVTHGILFTCKSCSPCFFMLVDMFCFASDV